MSITFAITNPPASTKRVGHGVRHMAGKQIVKHVAQRSRRFLGLSVPVVETGAVTAGGVFLANWTSAKVGGFSLPYVGTWWGKALVKIATGVVAKMILSRVAPKYANGVLGGCLASATLTVAKNFLPANSSMLSGLGGDLATDAEAGFSGLGALNRSISAMQSRLTGLAGMAGLGYHETDQALGMYGH